MSEAPTIVLRRKLTKEEIARKGQIESVQKVGAGKNNQGYYNPTNQRKLDIDDIPVVPMSTTSIAQTIRDTRGSKTMPNGKAMTQDDLARQCNMPAATIKAYENGTAVLKQDEITKINRALGTSIKIPKVKKVEQE